MMKATLPSLAGIAIALSLAACSSEPTEPEVQGTDAPIMESAAAGGVTASEAASPASTEVVADDAMPQGMRGRWGLVPLDCTGDPAAAKGLVAIGADSMKFYESVAKLGMIERVDPQTLVAAFEFSGEGHTWVLDVTLELSEDGQTLVRRDKGPDAMPEPLTYTRCPA